MQQRAGEAEALLFAAGEDAVPFVWFVQMIFQTTQSDLFQGCLNESVVLADGVGIADGMAQGVGGEVGALGQEEEAAVEGEAALIIRP